MIFVRFSIPVFFATAAMAFWPAPAAHSETKVRECHTVQQLARLDYDSRLATLVVEDDDNDTCYFFVTSPVADKNNAAATAATMVQEAKLGKIEPDTVTGLIFSALIEPLERKAINSLAYAKLISRLKEQPDAIGACVEKNLFSNEGLVPVNDTVTCGVEIREGQSIFVLAAKLEGVTATFEVPLLT